MASLTLLIGQRRALRSRWSERVEVVGLSLLLTQRDPRLDRDARCRHKGMISHPMRCDDDSRRETAAYGSSKVKKNRQTPAPFRLSHPSCLDCTSRAVNCVARAIPKSTAALPQEAEAWNWRE
jgi:hypothetical protein